MSRFTTLPGAGAGPSPTHGHLPGFDGATGWLNSRPLTSEGLRGQVVLVDFWTYTCINWLRTLAYVRAWAEKYEDRGLTVVGVHTPEFWFEQDPGNVRAAVQDMAVRYPVALDSDYAIWRAFANRYWPAVYIADAQGRIRHHQFGEGGYEECERVIQQLLGEAGHEGVEDDVVSVAPEGLEAQADWANLGSPETYLDERRPHVTPERLKLNEWGQAGEWTVERGASVLQRAGGSIAFRFHARDVHLVMAPPAPDASVPFRALVDGEPPGDAHGLDVDEQGHGTVTRPRLYQLVREPRPISDRTLEITFLVPGVEAYVFTFG